MFGSSREFADNNNVDIKSLKKGTCGLFQYTSSSNSIVKLIGEIIEIDECKAVIQKYISFGNDSSGNHITCKKGNLIEVQIENIIAKGALDLYMKDHSGNTIINSNKFGTIMLQRHNPISQSV